MRESKTIEFKLQVSPSFLKTVSSFANGEGGTIYFGIDDDGKTVGISDPIQTRLNIENAINDGVDPRPTFSLETELIDNLPVIVLKVEKGDYCPYLYQGKAYNRSDTADVPLDSAALRKLARRGVPEMFEGAPSQNQNLTFTTLGHALEEALDVDSDDLIVLKTLGLYKNGSFDNVAALLSDENPFPGIELVRYDQDDLGIFERMTLDSSSVLSQLAEALHWYERYYVVEQVRGAYRTKIELVPKEAFREAVANALVHRDWLIRGRITVSMYQDRIVTVSPGGLPEGVDEQQYLDGGLSVPRNENLAYALLRLGIMERLGSGVRRIRQAYISAETTPSFAVSDNSIRVVLPLVKSAGSNLSEEERAIISFLAGGLSNREDIEKALGVSRATTTRLLKSLLDKGFIERVGQGRSTKYRRLF